MTKNQISADSDILWIHAFWQFCRYERKPV